MKYISNVMKFGTQSRSSSLILNMIFESCGFSPEIKNVGRFGLKIAMCSCFYEILQIKHASYDLELMILTQNYRFREIGPNTEICSNLYEIWHSQQMEHANWLRMITLSFFISNRLLSN